MDRCSVLESIIANQLMEFSGELLERERGVLRYYISFFDVSFISREIKMSENIFDNIITIKEIYRIRNWDMEHKIQLLKSCKELFYTNYSLLQCIPLRTILSIDSNIAIKRDYIYFLPDFNLEILKEFSYLAFNPVAAYNRLIFKHSQVEIIDALIETKSDLKKLLREITFPSETKILLLFSTGDNDDATCIAEPRYILEHPEMDWDIDMLLMRIDGWGKMGKEYTGEYFEYKIFIAKKIIDLPDSSDLVFDDYLFSTEELDYILSRVRSSPILNIDSLKKLNSRHFGLFNWSPLLKKYTYPIKKICSSSIKSIIEINYGELFDIDDIIFFAKRGIRINLDNFIKGNTRFLIPLRNDQTLLKKLKRMYQRFKLEKYDKCELPFYIDIILMYPDLNFGYDEETKFKVMSEDLFNDDECSDKLNKILIRSFLFEEVKIIEDCLLSLFDGWSPSLVYLMLSEVVRLETYNYIKKCIV